MQKNRGKRSPLRLRIISKYPPHPKCVVRIFIKKKIQKIWAETNLTLPNPCMNTL